MNKLIGLLLIVTILLGGCSYMEQSKTAVAQLIGGTSETESVSSLAEDEYLLSGKVKTIKGNEIELELGTLKSNMPSTRGGQNGGITSSEGANPGEAGLAANAPANRRSRGEAAQSQNGTAGSTGKTRTAGQNRTGTAVQPQGDRQTPTDRTGAPAGAMGGMGTARSVELQKSGETKIFLIPVKTPVYASGNTSTQLSFLQLKVGAVITAIMRKNDSGDDTFVSIQVVG